MTTSEWSDIFAKIKKLSDADKERLLIFLHALKGNEDSSIQRLLLPIRR